MIFVNVSIFVLGNFLYNMVDVLRSPQRGTSFFVVFFCFFLLELYPGES